MSKIFSKSYSGKTQFIGDFESFYKSDNPWNQDLEGKHLIKEYLYSRKNILSNLSKLDFKSLADIGCGYGKFTNEIKLRFIDKYICGFDISRNAIFEAKKRYKLNLNFYEHNIREKPLSKKYDLLLLNQILYYIIEDEEISFKNIISSSNKYLYFNIFMNKSHKYGEKHFRNGELFSKYMVEKYNLYLVLTSNKKIGDNHCYEVIFDVNKK